MGPVCHYGCGYCGWDPVPAASTERLSMSNRIDEQARASLARVDNFPTSQLPNLPTVGSWTRMTPREQLRALVETVEWKKLLCALSSALRKAPSQHREDLKSEVFLALVERAEQSAPIRSWIGLAVVIANRVLITASARDRLKLHDLEFCPATCE
jgi:hypothetical protein